MNDLNPVLRVSLLSDTRTSFGTPASTGASVLNSYEVEECLIVDKWNEKSVVTVKFYSKIEDAKNWLLPGNRPGNALDSDFVRARWIAIENDRREFKFYMIDTAKIQQVSSRIALVEVEASDPREWLQTHPTSFTYANKKEKDVTRTYWLSKLSDEVSSASSFAPVPIVKLSTSALPTGAAAVGGVLPSAVDDGEQNTYFPAFPLSPMEQGLKDFLDEWGVELYPFPVHSTLGVRTPWWQWIVRKKVDKTADWLFSEYNGTLKLDSITADNTVTETLSYDSSRVRRNALGGDEVSFNSHIQAKTELKNQWLGLQFVSESVDSELEADHSASDAIKAESADLIKRFLRKSARWNNTQVRRLRVEGQVIFSKSGITNPLPGMKISLRILDKVSPITIYEVASHYMKDSGWSKTSPIEYRGDAFNFEGDLGDDKTNNWADPTDNPMTQYGLAPLLTGSRLTAVNVDPSTTTYIPYNSNVSTIANCLRFTCSNTSGTFTVRAVLKRSTIDLRPGDVLKDLGTITVAVGANAIVVPKFVVPDEYFFLCLENPSAQIKIYGGQRIPHMSVTPSDPKLPSVTSTGVKQYFVTATDIPAATTVPYVVLGSA